MDIIQRKLYGIICNSENNVEKSSHWLEHTKNFELINGKVSGIDGFAGRTRKYIGSQYIHSVLQARNFSDLVIPRNSKFYSNALDIAEKQNRCLDLDLLRHVFTFEYLDEKIGLRGMKNICVIGDGQANFASLALNSNLFQKVISINLPEVLMSDWELLKCVEMDQKTSVIIKPADMDSFLKDEKSLGLIPASLSKLLKGQNIDLFVNIASFQEMKKETVAEYFDLIKSSPKGAVLYCCNRVEKQLYGGEISKFEEYPWEVFETIIEDEACPWHQHFYKLRRSKLIPIPATKIKYDGIHMHRLVKYPCRGIKNEGQEGTERIK